MNKRAPFFAVFLISYLLFSCQNLPKEKHHITIVTTTGHIADMVRNIVGNKAKVYALMGPGVDPHLYKASLSDLKLMSDADIIFYNGLHLEGKMSEIFQKLKRTKKVVAVSDGIPKHLLLMADSSHGIPDPHIWFDVSMWRYCLKESEKTLAKEYPEHAFFFKSNAAAYDEELKLLDEQAMRDIESIPAKQRVLVTAHDAFGYFGKRYHMEVIGLQGISTLSEYGLSEITSLTKTLVVRNIQAIFVETSISEKAINSVIEGCKRKGHKIHIGGSLYSDALGAPNMNEGTYIGMFKANVKLIKQGLNK